MECINNLDLLKEITPKMVKNHYNAKRASIFFFNSPKKILCAGLTPAKPLECVGAFFIENNNGNPALMVKLFCLHVKSKKLIVTGDIFYYENMENMELVCSKLNDFVFSSKGNFVFPFPPIKAVCPLRKLGLLLKILKALSGEKSYENPVRAYKN